MASEDWPETSTPHKMGKDVEEEEEVFLDMQRNPSLDRLPFI